MPDDDDDDDDDEGLEDEDGESLSDHKDSDTEVDSVEIPEVSYGTSSSLKHSQVFTWGKPGLPPAGVWRAHLAAWLQLWSWAIGTTRSPPGCHSRGCRQGEPVTNEDLTTPGTVWAVFF